MCEEIFMFENLKTGWALGKQVRKLVFSDKGLVIYPILSAIVIFIELFLIFGSLVFAEFLSPNSVADWLFVIGIFAFYLVSTFTATYILVALLLSFRAYVDGSKITMKDAFSQASKYAVLILEWAIFYSIILMIVRAIESRLGLIGRVIFGFAASIAIGVATMFAIPVIIDNKVGPIKAVKMGADFFLKNFGKTVGGIVYSDLYNLMFIVLGIVLIVIGAIAASISIILGVSILLLGLLIFAFGLIMNFLTVNVYKLVLYDYLNGGKLPKGISEDLVNQSVNKAKQRAGS